MKAIKRPGACCAAVKLAHPNVAAAEKLKKVMRPEIHLIHHRHPQIASKADPHPCGERSPSMENLALSA